MDAQRAQELSESPKMANVTYNGQRIFIEHVDETQGQATIHPIDDPTQKLSVSVNELTEQ
ncbi:small acid-soluble spore protein H [Bacillus alkalicellulosilyticus]|uniref:small acid-soluble spore protein H n=1 Tax=Alkalihalobacterium alkalicellulosilyticum TaxID=1912214 RepID=UPI000996C4E8|nr:small acid-soluble spore protein H [Bacillus alkalicellulosilyticus]